jgi:hypothetical protein
VAAVAAPSACTAPAAVAACRPLPSPAASLLAGRARTAARRPAPQQLTQPTIIHPPGHAGRLSAALLERRGWGRWSPACAALAHGARPGDDENDGAAAQQQPQGAAPAAAPLPPPTARPRRAGTLLLDQTREDRPARARRRGTQILDQRPLAGAGQSSDDAIRTSDAAASAPRRGRPRGSGGDGSNIGGGGRRNRAAAAAPTEVRDAADLAPGTSANAAAAIAPAAAAPAGPAAPLPRASLDDVMCTSLQGRAQPVLMAASVMELPVAAAAALDPQEPPTLAAPASARRAGGEHTPPAARRGGRRPRSLAFSCSIDDIARDEREARREAEERAQLAVAAQRVQAGGLQAVPSQPGAQPDGPHKAQQPPAPAPPPPPAPPQQRLPSRTCATRQRTASRHTSTPQAPPPQPAAPVAPPLPKPRRSGSGGGFGGSGGSSGGGGPGRTQSEASLLTELVDLLWERGIQLDAPALDASCRALCPECSGGRSRELSLSVTPMRSGAAVWNCFRATCGWSGAVHAPGGAAADGPAGAAAEAGGAPPAGRPGRPPARLPDTAALRPLSAELLAWFAARRISAATLAACGVAMERRYVPGSGAAGPVDAIAFPYIKGGAVVNIKYRALPKAFSQTKGGEQVLYGIDDVAVSPGRVG